MTRKRTQNNPDSVQTTGFPAEDNLVIAIRLEREQSEAQRRREIMNRVQTRVASASQEPGQQPPAHSPVKPPCFDERYENGLQRSGKKAFSAQEGKITFSWAKYKLQKAVAAFQTFSPQKHFYRIDDIFSTAEISAISARLNTIFSTIMMRHNLNLQNWEEQIKTLSARQINLVSIDLKRAFSAERQKLNIVIRQKLKTGKKQTTNN